MPRRISLYNQSNTSIINEDETIKKIENLFHDTSLTIAPQEFQSLLANAQRHEKTLRDLIDESTATGLVLKANEPYREAIFRLHYEFLESARSHSSELEVFEMIEDLIQNCTETLEVIRGMKSKVEYNDLSTEEINLENERNTWRLIHCLYQNRLLTEDVNEDNMNVDNGAYISEKETIEAYYGNSKVIREYQLIVDWLEKNALDQANRLPEIEHFTDRTIAWENTFHQLQNEKTGITFRSTRPIITSLDPDAPVRENKALHDLDKEDDARLEKRMLIEVRCGRLKRAQALANHCGQHWRAACLLGWVPYNDPNFQNFDDSVKMPIEGNPNRSLWKLCAWDLSNDPRVGQYYRAIYSSFCGNVKQLLTVAQSWQDGLWAYMKSLVDIKVESEVRTFMPKKFVPMPEEYWKGELTVSEIFSELESSKNSAIRQQSYMPAHQIQKYLILDDIKMLMKNLESIVSEDNCDKQLLRFLAHVVLFLRQIGKNMNDEVANKVLLAYVETLSEIGDPTLVAYYTSTLPNKTQITSYAAFLENVKDYEKRRQCLAAAEEANLNVEAITKLVVENIRKKNTDLEDLDLKGQITADDLDKINALDWLTFYPSQREEVLWQTNALIRYFLIKEKLDAARKAYNKVPHDAIESIIKDLPDFQNTIENLLTVNMVPKRASSSIREYMSYKSYLDAQEGFSEWFTHYHHDKPVPVEELTTYATFTEKVAYEHKKSQYNSELERWKATMQQHTKAVKHLLFNVLLFPDGGWLIDANDNTVRSLTSEEELREHQLDSLRKLCIPKITFLLHTVMSEMNEHAECIQLADTLASEQYQLYKIFSKHKLREVYKKICESSLALMNQKKDPWGYAK